MRSVDKLSRWISSSAPSRDDELGEFLRAVTTGFGMTTVADENDEYPVHLLPADRSPGGARRRHRSSPPRARSRSDVTVPGGARVPIAAVTTVTVHPTHRRRGVLRRMMDEQLDDVARRGEPLAVLTASEASIYERFGYGTATFTHARGSSSRSTRTAPTHPTGDRRRTRAPRRRRRRRPPPRTTVYERASRARASASSIRPAEVVAAALRARSRGKRFFTAVHDGRRRARPTRSRATRSTTAAGPTASPSRHAPRDRAPGRRRRRRGGDVGATSSASTWWRTVDGRRPAGRRSAALAAPRPTTAARPRSCATTSGCASSTSRRRCRRRTYERRRRARARAHRRLPPREQRTVARRRAGPTAASARAPTAPPT